MALQYNQLIARRIRRIRSICRNSPYFTSLEEIKKHNPKGIILSGGPSSVFGERSGFGRKRIVRMGVPVLGIRYGMQLISHLLGGEVKKGGERRIRKIGINGFSRKQFIYRCSGTINCLDESF